MVHMTSMNGGPAITIAQDVEMPLVGLGTWQLRGRRGYDAVRYALEVGYRQLDTATVYGNEADVGRAVRDSDISRGEIFVTTKVPENRVGRERDTIAASLTALGTEYVDLWLVHWPPRRGTAVRMWQEMRSIRDDGLARAVGVSNFSTAEIDELIDATGEAPAVNQIPWAPRLHDRERVAESRKRGVVLEGYSPFKRGDLRNPVLAEIASRHGVTTAQVIVRWHLAHEIVVIPKSATPERIASNFDVFGFSLTVDEIARIDALGR
jgi:2,5-diketo-D-gluconate reductase A